MCAVRDLVSEVDEPMTVDGVMGDVSWVMEEEPCLLAVTWIEDAH